MTQTQYSRKLDATGRLQIPKELQQQMGIYPGKVYNFYQHNINGRFFLCISAETELDRAIRLLESNGYEVKKLPPPIEETKNEKFQKELQNYLDKSRGK